MNKKEVDMAKRISQPSSIQQYRLLKLELPRRIILFMLIGKFYVTYGEDACISQPILGSPLLPPLLHNGIPICKFLRDDVSTALAKLIRVGKSVALAERLDDGAFCVTHIFN